MLNERSIILSTDPKHTSIKAREFYERNQIKWWKTPAESPDINPIECIWAEMKQYIRKKVNNVDLFINEAL